METKETNIRPGREEAFDALITGEYKDLYTARVEAVLAEKLGLAKEKLIDLSRQLAQQKRSGGQEQVYAALLAEAQALTGIYPGFDVAGELQSPRFRQLLEMGLDMKTAFEATHHDTLVEEAMAYALAHGSAKRPVENGQRSLSAASTVTGVRSMSRADRRDIIRRVSQGETIRL